MLKLKVGANFKIQSHINHAHSPWINSWPDPISLLGVSHGAGPKICIYMCVCWKRRNFFSMPKFYTERQKHATCKSQVYIAYVRYDISTATFTYALNHRKDFCWGWWGDWRQTLAPRWPEFLVNSRAAHPGLSQHQPYSSQPYMTPKNKVVKVARLACTNIFLSNNIFI